LIVEFLPDPVGDKFANLFGIKINQSSSWKQKAKL
jgi:hypothetical protein